MYDNHPLVEAARYNDAQSEELGLKTMLDSNGVDLHALMHIAKQRALRLVVLRNHGEQGMKTMIENGFYDISAEDERLLLAFTTAFVDGIMIGWKAAAITNRND